MLAFIHTQKAAGTTLSWILRSSYGLRHLGVDTWRGLPHQKGVALPFRASELRYTLKFMPYLKSIHGHRVQPYADLDQVCPDIRYFTFMREPLAQCASWYQHLVQTQGRIDLTFKEYLQNPWVHNRQTQILAGTQDVNDAIRIIQKKAIFVGLVEHFDESLILLKAFVANDLGINYERRGTAPKNQIAKALLADKQTRQMLSKAVQAD